MKKIYKLFLKLFSFLQLKYQKIYLNIFNVRYGSNLYINGRIFVRNKGKFSLGQNVKINSNISSNPVGGPYKASFVVSENAELKIGDNVGMSGVAIVAQEKVIIEDNVKIGSGVCIYDTDFHSVNYEKRISSDDDITKKSPVKICEGAFIGARSIILKGVTIGDRSIIGAGSVVTKDGPPNQVWGGNPATCIRKLI